MTQESQKAEEVLRTMLDKKTVCERFSISPRTLENFVRDGQFPPPVKLGKCVYWSELAVSKWHKMLFAAQEAWRP
jgi:prophage regulatory protein